jgi:pimeloyl-ACP methyl ester carboxylesterase
MRGSWSQQVALASSFSAPFLPTTVLIHGLDSSRETWCGTLATLASRGYPAVALDLRGHGESPLGPIDDFSAESLALDVLAAIRSFRFEKGAVLVGHSMGGRVAMRAAALDAAAAAPERLLSSVVIEDMDVRARRPVAPPSAAEAEALGRFAVDDGRRFASFEACRDALLPFYQDAERVDKWRGTRVRQRWDGSWWSDLNPAAQRLARERILATTDGFEAWNALADRARPPASLHLAVHLWHADAPGTVCELEGAGGIEDMARRLPTARVRRFVGAGHSIHNTAAVDFADAVCAVVDEAQSRLAATV